MKTKNGSAHMDSKWEIVIVCLIGVGLLMTAPVAVSASEANTAIPQLKGDFVGDEITVMLPGEVPLVMVRIPAGTFLMGSPEGERGNVFDNETQHQVTLTQDYYIGQTEITQQQWQAVMGSAMPTSCGDSGVGDEYPLYCVTWTEIAGPEGFIDTLNQQQGSTAFRLPTEAEWERATRAGTTTRFFYGDVLECDDLCGACDTHDQYMWWCGNSPAGTRPVGQKEPNPFGLYDASGNVWEFVQDRYGEYSPDPVTDPTGPDAGNDRVIRGGDSTGEAQYARSACRVAANPGEQGRTTGLGFRLAATASAVATLDNFSFVPAVAFAAGAQGAFFESDLDLNNAAPADGASQGMDVEYEFWWLPRGEDNSDPMVSETYSLGAGMSVRIANVLSEVFGLEPDEVGALAIAASSQDLIGMSRTYNTPPGDAGTFGQAPPAVPEAELVQTGETRRIVFMSENADFRANLGCVNGTDMQIQILIDLYDASGTLLETKTMTLGPWSNKQINRVFSDYQPVDGYVDVHSDTEGASYYCYGSVLDNVTSDPTTILPQ